MKIITCASYFGTGSSALTDLFSEYSNVHPNNEFEFRFAHDPNGMMDLEYHLVENFNREVSGYGLKQFYKFCKYNHGTFFNKKYEKYFKGKYLEYSKQYIDALTDFSYKGFWHYDLAARGKFAYYFLGIFNKINIKLKAKKASVLPKEITYCSNPGLDKFLLESQKYTSNLLECLNDDNKPYMVVDQLVPSSNTAKAMRYFKDEMFVFIVDRDPRDVYMLCKTIWRWDHIFPHDSVESWCKWFRYVREQSKNQNNDHIMYLQFEDIIYHYDEVVKKVEEFTHLDSKDHIHKFERLNPKRSFYNTQIYLRNKKWEKDIKKIEELLPEFLYDFSKVKEEDVVGVEPDSKGTF